MKKILAIAVIAIMATVGANAQEQGKLNYMVRIGANYATLAGIDDAKYKFDFEWDIVFNYCFTDQFAMGLEWNDEYLGCKSKTTDKKIKMHYASFPLLAKYYVTPWMALQAGPQLGILTSAKDDGVSVRSAYHKVDFSLPMGFSLEPQISSNGDAIVIDFRYRLGLTNILKESSDNIRNTAFILTVGYKTDFLK